MYQVRNYSWEDWIDIDAITAKDAALAYARQIGYNGGTIEVRGNGFSGHFDLEFEKGTRSITRIRKRE